jgi:hypothetical protein
MLIDYGIRQQITATSTLLSGLTLYYKLDETSGTNLADALGNHTAVLSGTAAVNAVGILGRAVDFTGTDGCITLPSGWATSEFTDKITISVWINPDTLTNAFYFFNFKNAGESARVYANFVPADGTIYIACLPTSPTYTEFSTVDTNNVSTGSWQNFVFVCGGVGSTIRMYKNGSELTYIDQFTVITSFDTLGSILDSIFNQGETNTNALDGKGDEVGIWNRALTTTEITELYNGGSGKTHPFS